MKTVQIYFVVNHLYADKIGEGYFYSEADARALIEKLNSEKMALWESYEYQFQVVHNEREAINERDHNVLFAAGLRDAPYVRRAYIESCKPTLWGLGTEELYIREETDPENLKAILAKAASGMIDQVAEAIWQQREGDD